MSIFGTIFQHLPQPAVVFNIISQELPRLHLANLAPSTENLVYLFLPVLEFAVLGHEVLADDALLLDAALHLLDALLVVLDLIPQLAVDKLQFAQLTQRYANLRTQFRRLSILFFKIQNSKFKIKIP